MRLHDNEAKELRTWAKEQGSTLGDPRFEIFFNQPSPRCAWAIIDTDGLAALGVDPEEIALTKASETDLPIPPNNLGKGFVASEDTIEVLAEDMGLDVESVVATFARYNELAASGTDEWKYSHALLREYLTSHETAERAARVKAYHELTHSRDLAAICKAKTP